MFSLTVRRNFMIAHSLPRPAFGPAQGMHGATFVTEVTFRRRALNEDSIVLDIGAAGERAGRGPRRPELQEPGRAPGLRRQAQHHRGPGPVHRRRRGGEDPHRRGRPGAGRPGRHPPRNPRRLGQLLARLRGQLDFGAGQEHRASQDTVQPGGLRLRSWCPATCATTPAATSTTPPSPGSLPCWEWTWRPARSTAAGRLAVRRTGGGWPPCCATRRRNAGGTGAGHTVTIVDGLLACGAPEELAAAAAAGRPAWILLHMPLDDTGQDEAGLERRALRAAAGVICTSTSAASRIRARHGLDGIRVALPGTDTAALAPGSEPPHLVAVAALLPNKDQSLLLAALVSPDGPALDGVPDRFRHRGPGLCRAAPGHGDAAGAAGPRPDPGGAARGRARGGMGGGRPQPAHLAGRDLRPRGHGIDCPGCARRGPGRHRRRRSARSRHRRRQTPPAASGRTQRQRRERRQNTARQPCPAPPSHLARTRLPSRRCCGAGCPNPGSGPAGGPRL